MHEVGVAHHVGDGGVFDYDHELRDQRRNDKPNSLRQHDFKGDFSLGETERLGRLDLPARYGVDAGAENLGQYAGRSERDGQCEHPKRRQRDLVLRQHQKEEVDEQQARYATEEVGKHAADQLQRLAAEHEGEAQHQRNGACGQCDLDGALKAGKQELPGGEVRKEVPVVDRKLTGHIKALQYQGDERRHGNQ